MMIGYQRKLAKYQEYMNILNENSDITEKVLNLLRYARSNNLIDYKFALFGEIEAIYDFYYVDMNNFIRLAKEMDDKEIKDYYLDRANADKMLIDEISENGRVKKELNYIYKCYKKVEELKRFIKEEDLIEFKSNAKNIPRL